MSNTELLNQLLNLTIWLPIKGYENYDVSISGSVRNVNTKRILKQKIVGIDGNKYYAIDLWKKNKGKMFKIHRLVAKAFLPNVENKECVDHVYYNKLNNTISNLRWCDLSENQYNRKLNKNSISGVKGVSWVKRENKWRSRITFKGKEINLGYFDNIEDAKLVRQKKAAELFKEFLNACEK